MLDRIHEFRPLYLCFPHLIIQVGQDHDDLDLLLRYHLPHAGDSGVQRVLGQDESLPVVET